MFLFLRGRRYAREGFENGSDRRGVDSCGEEGEPLPCCGLRIGEIRSYGQRKPFTVLSGALAENWHTAPRRQAIIILDGEVDLAVSDGGKRRFGPGHVLVMEDTTGKGHTTHSVEGREREEVWVALE